MAIAPTDPCVIVVVSEDEPSKRRYHSVGPFADRQAAWDALPDLIRDCIDSVDDPECVLTEDEVREIAESGYADSWGLQFVVSSASPPERHWVVLRDDEYQCDTVAEGVFYDEASATAHALAVASSICHQTGRETHRVEALDGWVVVLPGTDPDDYAEDEHSHLIRIQQV